MTKKFAGKPLAFLAEARRSYHAALLGKVLVRNAQGIPSNADGSQRSSIALADGILRRLGVEAVGARLAGQMAGNEFEAITCAFVSESFGKLRHLRPGDWMIHRVTARGGSALGEFEQYAHLLALKEAASKDPQLAAALGNEYTITPDIVIVRKPEPDERINQYDDLVEESVARRTSGL